MCFETVFSGCRGGIALTVQGENLDPESVFPGSVDPEYVMETTMVYQKQSPNSEKFHTLREETFNSVSIFSQYLVALCYFSGIAAYMQMFRRVN